MKKLTSVLMAVVLLVSMVSVIASCSRRGVPNFDVPEGGYDGSEVNITFYHTMGSNLTDILDPAIEEFNKLYPNIHVNSEKIGGYDDVRNQVQTEITQPNGGPNIAYCYPDHVALYMRTGKVAALDNLIESTIETTRADGSKEVLGLTKEQIADFIPGYYAEGQQFGDELMYTMPFSKSTEVLYYNKTFFTANNLSIPDHWFSNGANDTTSMEYVCKKIKEIDPNSIPLGYDSEANWFITMCEQMGSGYTSSGSNHFLFDNKQNRDLWIKFRDWYQNGWITTQKLYGAYTSGLFTTTDAASSKSYMSIGSSAGATHQRPSADSSGKYPFDVGIVEIPQMDAKNPKVISQGPSVCIFKKDNPQEVVASWLFVKYLTTSVEFQAEFSLASGYVPVIQSVNENKTFADALKEADGGKNIASLSLKVCLEQKDAYYVSPAFRGSSKARDEVGGLVSKVLVMKEADGKIADQVKKAFQAAIEECEYAAD